MIYLCRHGETEWSLSGKHTGRTDLPLTQKGQVQAAQLRQRLKKLSFDHIFTSPRQRAKATCEGMGAIEEPLAVELDYGDYEGLTRPEILSKASQWDPFTQGGPHGETPAQVGKRADLLLQKFLSLKGNTLLFSHGHFLRIFTARYLGLPVEAACYFLLSVASLSILGRERDHRAIVLWNDVSHLM